MIAITTSNSISVNADRMARVGAGPIHCHTSRKRGRKEKNHRDESLTVAVYQESRTTYTFFRETFTKPI